MDKRNVERRRKLLDVFVNKVTISKHLYNSKPFQCFIRNPNSYETSAREFHEICYGDIAAGFLHAFNDLGSMSISPKDEEKVGKNLRYFNYALASFQAFETICKENVEGFYSFEESMEDLMGSIKEVNDFYSEFYDSKGFEVKIRDQFTNPYMILLDWSRAEVLDLQAIIEAIESRNKIMKKYKKVYEKYDNEVKSLDLARTGKKKNGLGFGLKGESEQKNLVGKLESEIKAMEVIYRMSTLQLLHKDFPVFKQYKVHKHEVILRTFSSASIEEFQELVRQILILEKV
jgi:hypothetical protein